MGRDQLAGDWVLNLDLPPQPAELAAGHCASGLYPRDLWVSRIYARRKLAASICLTCPAPRACLRYSLSLPDDDTSIWGGLWPGERRKLAQRLAEPELAAQGGG